MGTVTGLANALRRARVTRGWTQADLGRQVGVTQGAVSLWEQGEETPSFVHMLKLLVTLPELRASLPVEQVDLLVRVERAVFAEWCTCSDCSCHPDRPRPIA
ncbi:MAG: helix-turn-helix domain-containing protein [Firmicutes bacterium]|nr:helix-turn-helix domain-containing protein [Bacillota bacterium]